MPVYEYQCKTCGVRFERTQSFKDDPIKICPECSGETYRVIGATGIIFKGSGFYINDSKSKSTASSPAKAESKTDTAASTESKPEKSEAKTESSATASTPAASTTTTSTSTTS